MQRRFFITLSTALVALTTACADSTTAPQVAASGEATLARAGGTVGSPKFANNFTTCTSSATEVNCDYKITGLGSTSVTDVFLEADVLFNCQCRNNGGQIVEVKDFATTISVPQLNQQPENGQITNSISASLADAAIPSVNEVCPNGNWDIVNPQLAFAGGFQLFAIVSSGNSSLTIYSEYAQ